MDSPVVSVIIPVYNAELYIGECMESIKNQSFQDWEVILVDDGSTDESGNICDSYAAKDNRIKTMHKNNEGPDSARAMGVNCSRGRYIVFVDADDWIEQVFLEGILAPMLRDESVDHVICSYYVVNQKGHILQEKTLHQSDGVVVRREEYFLQMLNLGGFDANLWARAYKRKLCTEHSFHKELAFSEDVLDNWEICNRAYKLYYVEKPLYYHRMRLDGGVTYHLRNIEKRFDSVQSLCEIISHKDFQPTGRVMETAQYQLLNIYQENMRLMSLSREDYREVMKSFHCRMQGMVGNIISRLPSGLLRQTLEKRFTTDWRNIIDSYLGMLRTIGTLSARGGQLYIYGAGRVAMRAVKILEGYHIAFNGFIVSDECQNIESPDGIHAIFHFSEIQPPVKSSSIGILLCMNLQSVQEVLKKRERGKQYEFFIW